MPTASSLDRLKLARVLALKGTTYHVQGIDADAKKRLWVTSVDTSSRKGYLHEFSLKTGELLRAIEIQDGERFHPGGIASDAKSLWMPVAEYRANSSSVIQRRSKRTLQLEFQFAVPDHIGCIAVTPSLLIGGNWDSRDFYVWNHRGQLLRKVASSTANAYQDIKFSSKYIVASGLLADRTGAIDWLDLKFDANRPSVDSRQHRSRRLIHQGRNGNPWRSALTTSRGWPEPVIRLSVESLIWASTTRSCSAKIAAMSCSSEVRCHSVLSRISSLPRT